MSRCTANAKRSAAKVAKGQLSKSLVPPEPADGSCGHKQKVPPAPSSRTKSKVGFSAIDTFLDAYQAGQKGPCST